MMRGAGSLTHCKRFTSLLRRRWAKSSISQVANPEDASSITTGGSQHSIISAIIKGSGPLHHAASHPCSSAQSPDLRNKDSKLTRSMSTNTKGGTRPPPSSSTKGKGSSSNDQWRDDFHEKQADYKQDFSRVKDPPLPSNQQWWMPDPMTGVWVPVDYHGKVTTAPPKKKKNPTKVVRTETSLDKRWFENMEELPDLDRKPL